MSAPTHIPVLLSETIEALAVAPGGRYIDCTLGSGGHTAAILDHSSPGGQLLGIDVDPQAIKAARARLSAYGSSVKIVNENFVELEAICVKNGFLPVHGILLDLGLSSLQLNSGGRGFSFGHGPLDMRFSPRQRLRAADIVNTYSEAELSRLIRTYGEEDRSRRIARWILKERPVRTTLELAQMVERAVGGRKGRLHPATKTFQALRIAVNHELESLEVVLKQAVNLLGFEGRLVVISYHSLEDRIVKRFLSQESRDCICPPRTPSCVCQHAARLRLVTKRVITPSAAEVRSNPRSRSAKLRVAERIITRDEISAKAKKRPFLGKTNGGQWRQPAPLKEALYCFG